jgi:hypothetical protein
MTGQFGLKAHSTTRLSSQQLVAIHAWLSMARNAGLQFVPDVYRTRTWNTFVERDDCLWELLEWLPGHPDDAHAPDEANVLEAMRALAELHAVWGQRATPRPQPIPAIARRAAALQQWTLLLESGWRPRITHDDLVAPWAELAWQHLPKHVHHATAELARWANTEAPLHPCLCDIWYDHVLFINGRVSGLIDYSAAKFDHPAVDLARLLGSLAPEPTRLWRALTAYSTIRDLPHPDLVAVLERTGTIVAVTQWLTWLYHEQRHYPDRAALAARLQTLVARLTSF